ncbi:MAG: hypothetical protein ACRDIB_15980 [Ardenticatenaceae bacterium]
MCLSRTVEELFPFPHYIARKRRQRRRCESTDILNDVAFAGYDTLSPAQLTDRLKEERERAAGMDDKTFKLTLSLSVGLTVLGSTASFLVKAISSATVQTTLTIVVMLGVFYVLAAGSVALGALRTIPFYGYGTQLLLQPQGKTQKVLADALARQEIINNIRHLRNETAYQALRNGLLLLFAGFLTFAVTLAYQSLCP